MILPLLKGLKVTFSHILKPRFTIEYPEKRKLIPPRGRWLHELQRHPDGSERCVACMLCSAACPTGAIYIVGCENDPQNRVSRGERYAALWDLDLGRCIFCGYCAEACPEEAIRMTDRFELATFTRAGLLLHKEDLTSPLGKVPQWVWMGFYRKEGNKEPLSLPHKKHLDYEKYLSGEGR